MALLGTITAVNVPLLDPSIRSLMPVLRSNFWLSTHVIAVVSSYAAFALAWGLGLIALAYYLTATYRRSPKLVELLLPLIPGLPLWLVGGLSVAASYGMFGPQWVFGGWLFFAFSIVAAAGMVMSLGVIPAVAGELINRVIFHDTLQQADMLAASNEELAEGTFARARSSSSYLAGRSTAEWPHS